MKESDFIKRNIARWETLDQIINKKSRLSKDMGEHFIRLTDDLSHARTFYKNRSVRIYLNKLTQNLYSRINRKKNIGMGQLTAFFRYEFPSILMACRKEILFSAILFFVSALIGVISSIYDPNFYNLILSEGYVNMTNENINQGKPMAVYSSRESFLSFILIFFNNIKVDFYAFILGFTGIGSFFILLYNGILFGTFQHFFTGTEYFLVSASTIWVHGVLEGFAAILSGAAGFVIGRSVLFPKTYTRLQSLRMGAIKGGKLIIAVIPLTLIAAFIEGYVTGAGFPILIRAAVIVISIIFIIGYFIIYPIYLKYNHQLIKINLPQLKTKNIFEFKLTGIKTFGDKMIHSLHLLRGNKLWLPALILSAFIYSWQMLDFSDANNYYYPKDDFGYVIQQYFGNILGEANFFESEIAESDYIYIFSLVFIVCFSTFWFSYKQLAQQFKQQKNPIIQATYTALVASFMLLLLVLSSGLFQLFVIAIALPIFLFLASGTFMGSLIMKKEYKFSEIFKAFLDNILRVLFQSWLLFIIFSVVYYAFNSPIFQLIEQNLLNIFNINYDLNEKMRLYSMGFFSFFWIVFLYQIYLVYMLFNFSHFLERFNAFTLKQKINDAFSNIEE